MGRVDPTIEELQQRLRDLEARLAEAEIELAHERLRHREYSLGLMIENEAMREKHRIVARRAKRSKAQLVSYKRQAQRREAELRGSLEALYASRTWKIGRAVVRPLRGKTPGPRG